MYCKLFAVMENSLLLATASLTSVVDFVSRDKMILLTIEVITYRSDLE